MACCSSDIGQATIAGLPPSSFGRGRLSISAVCTSANARNICCSSGRLTKRAKRLRGRREAPSGEISMVSTTSPKVAAQPSKCSMPRDSQPLRVEEALHRVELDHGVGDRRAGGECHAVAGMLLAEIAGFHVEVEARSRAAGLDAGDALHLGGGLEVLEVMRLVDEDMIDAQLVEHQPVILLVLRRASP